MTQKKHTGSSSVPETAATAMEPVGHVEQGMDERPPVVPTRSLPDFVIAGQSKSGTTALHDMLGQHPQLFMSSPKEPNFFATDLCSPDTPGAFRQRTPDEYRSLFSLAPPNAICGESSACYLFSTKAAANLHRWNPAAKLIMILREPVDFLYSYYLQMVKHPPADRETAKSFRRALAAEQDRKAGRRLPRGQRVPQLLYYSERVKYREQLERYFARFPADQRLVLIYDDFKADNKRTLRRACRFLGVDEAFPFSIGQSNRGAKLRSRAAQIAIHHLSHGTGAWMPAKRAAKAVLPSRLSRRAVDGAYRWLAFRPKGEVEPALRRQLMYRFKSEVAAASDLLGRDLTTLWGYDKL